MLDVTEVLLNEGKVTEKEITPGLDSLSYRFGRFEIAEKEPGILRIENQGDRKISLSGNFVLTVSIPCARCLKPVRCRLDIRPELDIDVNDSDYIDGYNLDVDQLIHDEALLVWPEQVLCKTSCKGLCSTCGRDLNEGSCTCAGTDLDPRMAKILDIFSNYKEV